jgi:hypothetical protein
MAPARATGGKAARSWTRQFLSFLSDQTTNQTRVSKPLWVGLATTFHARNHRTATGSSREGAKSAMPKKSKNAEPSFPTVDKFKEQVI